MLGNLSGYILSIVGIMLLSVIVDVLLSEHIISKYVKSFMALIIVFVIISPVIKLKNGDIKFDFSNIFQNETTINDSLTQKLNEKKKDELIKTLCKKSTERGLKDLKFNVLLTSSQEFKVNKIEVYRNSIITLQDKQVITEIIKSSIGIQLDHIVYL